MRAAGFVRTRTGRDARTRVVELSPKARRIVPRLAAEWRATEAAVAEIESEIAYPLTRVVDDIQNVLAMTSFHDPIARHLAATGDLPERSPRS
ncbi:MAG TPA: hypothetical protein VIU11_22615 [Nakamurella sp.]